MKSLVVRITMICCLTLFLLTGLLFAASQYALFSMRNQVIGTQKALLTLYADTLDNALDSQRIDIAQYISTDLNLITLSLYKPNEDRYRLNLQSALVWLQRKIITSDVLQTIYIYAENSDTLLTASQAQTGLRHSYIKTNIKMLNTKIEDISNQGWNGMITNGYISDRNADEWVLIKAVNVSEKVSIGMIVSIYEMIPPLQEVCEYDGQITLVYDQNGSLLAPNKLPEGFSENGLNEVVKKDGGNITSSINGEKYVAICCDMSNAPVRFVTLLPEREVFQPLSVFLLINNYLPIALLIILALIVSLIIRHSLDKPFRAIIHAMQSVSSGDITVRLPNGTSSEFILLNNHFNEMVTRIGDLNRDVIEQTSRAHRAEIRHLQAQINPHFYQNTLNLVYNLAALQKYELIQKTTMYLADYFRFVMHSGDEMIHLEDEINHITNYMELQKIRYPGTIDYHVEIAEELKSLSILPLIVQPFVENSIIHGYTQRRGFRIDIRAYRNFSGMSVIEIEDNGNGMKMEMIETLNGIMDGTYDQQEQHMGVWNVVMRLHRYYGSNAKLLFVPKETSGTFVRIELSGLPEEEGDRNEVTDS